MSNTLLPCPFCGGEATVGANEYYDGANTFYTYCTSCGVQQITTKIRTDEAIAAWNRRAQPENEPLTLSELRGMGGEPVWIQESAPYTFAGYKILCSPVVDEYEDVCFEGGDRYYSHDYDKAWLAYRAKPERSEGK